MSQHVQYSSHSLRLIFLLLAIPVASRVSCELVESVRIGIVNGSEGVTCPVGRSCYVEGTLAELLFGVCHALNLPCNVTIYNDTEYGDVDEATGVGSGMVGAIQRGLFDTSEPFFTPTFRRLKAIDFSDTFAYGEYVLFTRTPDQKTGNFDLGIVEAFQWPVWAALAATLILMLSVMVLAKKQQKSLQFEPLRLISSFWSLGLVILMGAYTGVLFSEKIAPQSNLPFKDFQTFVTCLEENRCRMIQPTVSESAMQYLTGNETKLGRRIQATWVKMPMILKPFSMIFQSVLEEREIYLVSIAPKLYFDSFANGNEGCRFYAIEAPFKEVWAFPVRKNSSLMSKLNQVALAFHENGLYQRLGTKQTPVNKCDPNVRIKQSQFDSSNAAIFYIYCLGVCAAMIIFGLEVVFRKWRKPQQRR